ncbi:EPDR1 [Branchiostoma lanceolatum]|uniref:EPDR1 protein n=1 Tax=Branchiostoma lanceolatum TaxID=7740 RepID=A0A8K0F3V3_BRALA|nr:EPDR1 [Branchiostoma lanceolatum]
MLTFVAIALLLGATIADPVEDSNPSPCCVPKQWSGTMGIVSGSVSGGKPSTMNQTIMEFYDYDKMKVALVGDNFRIVEDYNKGVSYSIVSDQCTTSKLTNSLFNCIPANATFLGSYQYGGPKGLKVNDYSIDSFAPGLIGRISFTADSCLPVLETVVNGGNDPYIDAIGFVNIVTSIKDPSVFDVPSPPCPKDTDLDNVVDIPMRQRSIFVRLP